MAVQATGLRSHIWNNNLRSAAMLVAFPLIVIALGYVLVAAWYWQVDYQTPLYSLALSRDALPLYAPLILMGVGVWFAIAWFTHKAFVDAAMGAPRTEVPTTHPAYQQLETLCISRGIPMPRLQILETPARNAYASGLGDRDARVTVTRGLLDALAEDEVEAVLAHELVHIRERDVRTMMIAIVFVGILALLLEMMARGIFRSSFQRSHRHRRSGGNNAALFLVFAMVALAIAYAIAKVMKFAISRSREYVADAGAVGLTKNPDAMVRALQNIAGHAAMPDASAEVRELLFCDESVGLAGLFSTHPPILKRVEALRIYAGARI